MKIIEVRDGFIRFEADNSIYLSSFIQAAGMDKSYIAQVNQIKKFGNVTIANAKILFILTSQGLQNYDKTEPSKDAEISVFTSELLNNSINVKKPIILGKTLDNKNNIVMDDSIFNKKILFSIDSEELNNLLVRNLSKQFENIKKKTVIFDTLGVIKSKKFAAGVDFKLPIDKSTLMFMYQSCLDDATADSKSMIVEIFKDLSEYAETVPFVPFGTLKSIVDDMVDKQHIFKLLVLKNKLAKFEKLGYFATKQTEVDNLNKIFESDCVVVDLSKLDSLFQTRYIEFIYSYLKDDAQVIFELSNSISKKSLKYVLSDSERPTAIITHSKYKYLNDIKSMFDNFVIEPSITNNSLFKMYSSFFASMQKNTYLVVGEGINYIPMVSSAQIIDEVLDYIEEKEEPAQKVEELTEDELTEDDVQVKVEDEIDEEVDSEDEFNIEEEPVIDETDDSLIEDVEDNVPTQEEIIADIEEKSENIINSVSENLEEPQEIDLFDDEENEIESESEIEQVTEQEGLELIENSDVEEEQIETQEDETIIEPEYSEVANVSLEEEKDANINETNDINEEVELLEEEHKEDILQEDVELLQEDFSESITDEKLEIETIEMEETPNSSDNIELIDDTLDESALIQENSEENFIEDKNENIQEELTIQLNKDEDLLLQDIIDDEPKDNANSIQEVNLDEPQDVILLKENDDFKEFDEIVELDPADTDESDIIVDMSEEGNDNINIDDELDQQIVDDVDKVYTTMKDTEELEEISDSDLDLIDELNSDGDILEEYTGENGELSDVNEDILEQPSESIIPERTAQKEENTEILEKREANTPIVPVYDADIPQEDMVVSDPIQQGDSVIHAKYGNGVVEKMIKYGTKTLFSINFENIGRRLLDPALTEIKKV